MASSSHDSKATGTATAVAAASPEDTKWIEIVALLNAQAFRNVQSMLITPDGQKVILYLFRYHHNHRFIVLDTTQKTFTTFEIPATYRVMPLSFFPETYQLCIVNVSRELYLVDKQMLNKRPAPRIDMSNLNDAERLSAMHQMYRDVLHPTTLQAVNLYLCTKSGRWEKISPDKGRGENVAGIQFPSGSKNVLITLSDIGDERLMESLRNSEVSFPFLSEEKIVIKLRNEFWLASNIDFTDDRIIGKATKLKTWTSLFSDAQNDLQLIPSPDGRFMAVVSSKRLRVFRVLDGDLENLVPCLCRRGEFDVHEVDYPVWDPNSQFLLYDNLSNFSYCMYDPRREESCDVSGKKGHMDCLMLMPSDRCVLRYSDIKANQFSISPFDNSCHDRYQAVPKLFEEKMSNISTTLVATMPKELAAIVLGYAALNRIQFENEILLHLPVRFSHLQDRVRQCSVELIAEKNIKALHALECLVQLLWKNPPRFGQECVAQLWQESAFAGLKNGKSKFHDICNIIGNDKKPVSIAKFSIVAAKKEINVDPEFIKHLIKLAEALTAVIRQPNVAGPDVDCQKLIVLRDWISADITTITFEEVHRKITKVSDEIHRSKTYQDIKPAFDEFMQSTITAKLPVMRGGGAP